MIVTMPGFCEKCGPGPNYPIETHVHQAEKQFYSVNRCPIHDPPCQWCLKAAREMG
jgi:hypothetical protein